MQQNVSANRGTLYITQFHTLLQKMHKTRTALYTQPRAQTKFFLLTEEIQKQDKCNKTLHEEINIASAMKQEVLVVTVRFIVKERRNGQQVTGLEDRSLLFMNRQRLEGPVFTCTVRTSESFGESIVVLLTGSRGKNLLRKGCRKEGRRNQMLQMESQIQLILFPLLFLQFLLVGYRRKNRSRDTVIVTS